MSLLGERFIRNKGYSARCGGGPPPTQQVECWVGYVPEDYSTQDFIKWLKHNKIEIICITVPDVLSYSDTSDIMRSETHHAFHLIQRFLDG